MRANLTSQGPGEETNLLKLEDKLRELTVDALTDLCDLYNISKTNATKDVLVANLLSYIERNRALLVAEQEDEMNREELPSDCHQSLHAKVGKDDYLFDWLQQHNGVAFTYRLPIKEGEEGKEVLSRDANGKVMYTEGTGRFGSTVHLDMKCRNTMLRWGCRSCKDKCCSATFQDEWGESPEQECPLENPEALLEDGHDVTRSEAAAPPAAAQQALPPRKTPVAGAVPKCGGCCPMCDTPSHNARRPLDFLTLDTIYEHMGVPRGTSLTLGAIAKFYKMNPRQLISWSTAAFHPSDLHGNP